MTSAQVVIAVHRGPGMPRRRRRALSGTVDQRQPNAAQRRWSADIPQSVDVATGGDRRSKRQLSNRRFRQYDQQSDTAAANRRAAASCPGAGSPTGGRLARYRTRGWAAKLRQERCLRHFFADQGLGTNVMHRFSSDVKAPQVTITAWPWGWTDLRKEAI
jgi:hypothetical protein